MADSYEINLEIQGGEQPALVMETEGGATDGASARNAEAWANGTRNGVPVTEGDPAYHNNSKYYRDSAAAIVAGDIIDDDAGIGDYNLTWSADKLAKKDEGKAPVINVSDQASAAVKTLTDGANGMPMGLTVGIEPVQAGSGDPSPSNVRAISGWSAVKISRTGNNLYDGTVEDGYISDNGTVGTDNSNYHSDYIRVEEGESYTYSLVSNASSSANRRVHGYDANKQWVEMIQKNTSSGTGQKQFAFTVPSGVRYIRVQFYQTGAATNKDTNIQIEKGSASSYEQYTGQTYEITIPSTPGTVYGGSLTVNKDGTGKLVVDRGIEIVDGVDNKLTLNKSGVLSHVFRKPKPANSIEQGELCNKLETGGESTDKVSNGKVTWYAGIRGSYIYADTDNETVTTQEQFDAWCQQENLQIVYKLATPAEYTLTASQVNAFITSLKGVNNLYADSGNVLTVDYSADTKLYVDEHNAEEDTEITSIKGMIADSDAPVATASHAIGDVFICGNELLRATSVIVTGETISTGTGGNAETINLAEYIAEKATAIAGVQSNVDLLEEKAIALGLSPMNRRIFPNYNKGMQPGAGANLRYVDVLFNTIRSEGHDLTGSTFRGILMTSANGARLPGVNLNSDFTMYKSDFKPINTPTLQSGPAKLVVHVTQSGNNNGNTAVPITMFYTYDTNGHIKKTLFGAPAANGSYDMDWYYIMPDEFKTNKNICIGTNFRSPKQSIDMKFEFMFLLESIIPESIQTLTIDDTNMTVQDDPTT